MFGPQWSVIREKYWMASFRYQKLLCSSINMMNQKHTHEKRYIEHDSWSWGLWLDIPWFNQTLPIDFILLLKSRKLYPDTLASHSSLTLISLSSSLYAHPDLGCFSPSPPLGSSSALSSCDAFSDDSRQTWTTLASSDLSKSWEPLQSLPCIVLFVSVSISQTDVTFLVAVTVSYHYIWLSITVTSFDSWLTGRSLSLSLSLSRSLSFSLSFPLSLHTFEEWN